VFRRCVVQGAQIKGDGLAESVWEDCSFTRCAFVSCNLEHSRFEKVRFFDASSRKGCVFRFCNLRNVTFAASDLSMCRLTRSNAHELLARECRMRGFASEGTDFARMLGRVRRNKATFEDCDLSDSSFARADLSACTFHRCILKDADLSSASLVYAELAHCDCRGTMLDEADLSNADLRQSRLDGIDLTTLTAYRGVQISAREQQHLLRSIGVEVSPDEE
jgi:fluoroquinolone resistance protein